MTFGAARARMWGPVDAAVRCVVPLELRAMLARQSLQHASPHAQARLRSAMERIAALPLIVSREQAAIAELRLEGLCSALHLVYWDGLCEYERPLTTAREAAHYAAAGRSDPARAQAQGAVKQVLQSLLPGFRIQRHGFRWRSLSFEHSVIMHEAIIRTVCQEVDAEPRLLLPEGEPLLRHLAMSAVDRAVEWYQRGGR